MFRMSDFYYKYLVQTQSTDLGRTNVFTINFSSPPELQKRDGSSYTRALLVTRTLLGTIDRYERAFFI